MAQEQDAVAHQIRSNPPERRAALAGLRADVERLREQVAFQAEADRQAAEVITRLADLATKACAVRSGTIAELRDAIERIHAALGRIEAHRSDEMRGVEDELTTIRSGIGEMATLVLGFEARLASMQRALAEAQERREDR